MNRSLLRDGELRLLALGDSLTYGYMVPVGYLRPVQEGLAAALPEVRVQVFNHGACGDTIFGGLRRLPSLLPRLRPTVVFVQFGLNDCFSGYSATSFARGLKDAVDTCRQDAAATVLLVPPPPVADPSLEAQVLPFREAFDEVAARTGALQAPVLAVWNATPATEPLWLADGVHPTDAGYRRMGDAVLRALRGDR